MQPTTLPTALTYITLLSSIYILFCLTGCNPTKKGSNEYTIVEKINDRNWLKGKAVCSIDSILEKRNEIEIIYVFNYHDCETCINRGFLTVKEIDKRSKNNTVKVIASMFQEITSTQTINDYKNYIYKDEHDLIRKELKYIPTPALLIIDDSCRIKDAYLFTPSSKDEDIKQFTETCISTINTVRK